MIRGTLLFLRLDLVMRASIRRSGTFVERLLLRTVIVKLSSKGLSFWYVKKNGFKNSRRDGKPIVFNRSARSRSEEEEFGR